MVLIRPVLVALLCAPLAAFAQAWPVKPIRLVVPYPAGGAVDVVARTVGMRMGEALGQSLVIDNRSGGTGIIGTDIVAKSAADGHTLLLTAYPPHNVYPLFYRNVPFDAARDFTAIGPVVTVPQALVAHPSIGIHSIRELIDYAKKNPGKLSYGSSGVGLTSHVGVELLKTAAGLSMEHVAYKGGAPALNDVLGGQIPLACIVLSNVIPHVRAGKLRMLGVLQPKRASAAPDAPTIAESGVAGYEVPELYFALVGPAGLPAAIVARLNAEVNRATSATEVRAKLEGAGFEVAASTPAEFAETIAKHTIVYRKFVSDAGIRPE